MSISIVDYGMANLRSVQKAFEQVEAEAKIVSSPEEIAQAERIVLPGVGAFCDAAETLRQKHMVEPLLEHVKAGKPFLGICLGLQLLFDVGYEDGEHRGLGIIGGKCIRFDVDQSHKLKVPHMGWNQLNIQRRSPLFEGLPADPSVYFVHSYHVVPTDPGVIATTTDYGVPFVSSIWKDNVMATQFHPEKSQAVGLSILQRFSRL